MDPEVAFLRAVCAAPDDDTPRLVYADWLDEHDQPTRAAFVRAQVELAALTEDSPRRREVAFRAREWLDRHGAAWAPDGWVLNERRFARGFVEMIGLTAGELREHGAILFATNPVRRLWVSDLDGDVSCLRRSVPAGHAVTALDLTGNDLTADSLRALAAQAGHFPGLHELALMFNRLDDEAAQVLCGEPFFQHLPVLKCGANPLTGAGRQRLRDHFGDRVTFACERDADHLYAFQDGYLRTGFGTDFTQLLFVEHDGRLAIFDHAGNLLRTERRGIPADQLPSYAEWSQRQQRVNDEWRAKLGFEVATVRVKRFQFPDGMGVEDFVPDQIEAFEGPEHPERDDAREWIGHWLPEGRFRWNLLGDDWWLNRDGDVTDT